MRRRVRLSDKTKTILSVKQLTALARVCSATRYYQARWVYILPNACGRGWVRHHKVFFFMNSRQDKEFLEKNAFFG